MLVISFLKPCVVYEVDMFTGDAYQDVGRDYAQRNLVGTIVRRLEDGYPVKIHQVQGNNRKMSVSAQPLDLEYIQVIPLSGLNLEPVKLGFCRSTSGKVGVSFIARTPLRHDWRQGLRANNIRILYGDDYRFCSNRELTKTIMGVYPSFEEALDSSVNNPGVIIPFGRAWAIQTKGKEPVSRILYKWIGPVGDVIRGKVDFEDGYRYLLESFTEEVNNG